MVICQSSVLEDIPLRAMADKMGTFFACLHRALEDKTVSSVNADLGAEACSVWQDHLSSFREMFQISHPL